MQDGSTPTVWQEPTAGPQRLPHGRGHGRQLLPRHVQKRPSDTFGDWSKTSGVNSPGAFAVCTMTYGLVFDDNADVWGNSNQEEAEARTVKDYWESAAHRCIPGAPRQQGLLRTAGADPCDLSRRHRRSRLEQGRRRRQRRRSNNNDGGDNKDRGVTPPPPVSPSNTFSLPRKTISSKTGGATVSVKLPGAGRLEMVGTAKVGKEESIKVGRTVLNANAAGTFNLALKPSAAAKKLLRKTGSLKVRLKLTFTPTGGTREHVDKRADAEAQQRQSSRKSRPTSPAQAAPGLVRGPGAAPVMGREARRRDQRGR